MIDLSLAHENTHVNKRQLLMRLVLSQAEGEKKVLSQINPDVRGVTSSAGELMAQIKKNQGISISPFGFASGQFSHVIFLRVPLKNHDFIDYIIVFLKCE